MTCLRSRPSGVASFGRMSRHRPRVDSSLRPRSEIFGLAFALLGGRLAACDFFSGPGPDDGQTMLYTAAASEIGQIQITSMLWKFAARRMRPFQ